MNRREALERAGWVLGYAVSAPVLMEILNSCKVTPELPFRPVFLTENQARTVSDIAEIIIPKTDTPGAKDIGVPAFIDAALSKCYKKEDQDRFLSGLAAFEEGAVKSYQDAFIDLEPTRQDAYVRKVHDEALALYESGELKLKDYRPDRSFKEPPFILMVKELSLLAFFTSEPGATQVLQYNPVPGAYHGCLPLAEVGKTWATS
jgi:gluconate 2-dehydrogenase gamma chain